MRMSKGFGLIELLVVLVIGSLLFAIAAPAYDMYAERARVSAAVGDISRLSLAVEQFRLNHDDRIPMSLAELGVEIPRDPWGREYQFLNIPSVGNNKGKVRKDGRLNPLNSDFDLYSIGRDGLSASPLSAGESRDDIVRANNGAFIGLGEDY